MDGVKSAGGGGFKDKLGSKWNRGEGSRAALLDDNALIAQRALFRAVDPGFEVAKRRVTQRRYEVVAVTNQLLGSRLIAAIAATA